MLLMCAVRACAVELGVLGRGAGGMVLRAMHAPTTTVLALKCQRSRLHDTTLLALMSFCAGVDISDRGKRHQLVSELKEFASTDSDFIVKFYGAYFDCARCCFVLRCSG